MAKAASLVHVSVPVGVLYALCMGVAGNVLIGIGDLLTSLSSDVSESLSPVSRAMQCLFLVRGLGQIVATPLAAHLFHSLHGNSILVYCLVGISLLWAVSSYISSIFTLYLWFFATGLITATLDTGTQILTRRYYKDRAGPWLTANTLVFASAGLISPLVDYMTTTTAEQTFVYAAFSGAVVVLFLVTNEITIVPRRREEVVESLSLTENIFEMFDKKYQREWLMALMVFFAIGGQNVMSSYIITFVEKTSAVDSSQESALLSVFWAATVISRLVALVAQTKITLRGLVEQLYILLLCVAAATIPLFAVVVHLGNSSTNTWASVLLYGFFTGPVLGYLYDIQNRVGSESGKAGAILIFGMNMGTSIVPWLFVVLWDYAFSSFAFPIILLLCPCLVMMLHNIMYWWISNDSRGLLTESWLRSRSSCSKGSSVTMKPTTLDNMTFVVYFLLVLCFFLLSSSFPPTYAIQFGGDCNENGVFCSDFSNEYEAAIVAFFTFLAVVGVWGLFRRFNRSFRSLTDKTVVVMGFVTTPAIMALVAGFIVLSFWWWVHWYANVSYDSTPERLSKTFGHMNDLWISLLVLLSARASVWDVILGMSYEQGIVYHAWVGSLAFISITAHFVIWQLYWIASGTWIENAITYADDPNVNLMTGEACTVWETMTAYCGNGHFWAIPAMELWYVFLGVPALGVLAYEPMRRSMYQLFYYAHHHFLIMFPIAYYHSWNLWRYSTIGLFLWVISRILSRLRAQHKLSVLDMTAVVPGVTRLELTRPIMGGLDEPSPGMYVYLNIPELSALEWHPFSISSAPSTRSWTHHIRAVNKSDEWTARLYALAKRTRGLGLERGVCIYYDGPYGVPAFSGGEDVDRIVFVVGGIGITIVMSYLCYWAGLEPHLRPQRLTKVTLLWCVRGEEVLSAFEEEIEKLLLQPLFDIQLHVTGLRQFAQEDTPLLGVETGLSKTKLQYSLGRPDLTESLRGAVKDRAAGQRLEVGVFVCGPQQLVQGAKDACAGVMDEMVSLHLHAEPFGL